MSSALFWVVTAAVVLVEAAIIVTALRMKVTPDAGRGFLGTRPVEIMWTLLPAVLVAVLVLVSYAELNDG